MAFERAGCPVPGRPRSGTFMINLGSAALTTSGIGRHGQPTGESAAARPGDGAAAIMAYRRVRDRREITRVGNFVPLGNRLGGGDRHITWPGRRTARAT